MVAGVKMERLRCCCGTEVGVQTLHRRRDEMKRKPTARPRLRPASGWLASFVCPRPKPNIDGASLFHRYSRHRGHQTTKYSKLPPSFSFVNTQVCSGLCVFGAENCRALLAFGLHDRITPEPHHQKVEHDHSQMLSAAINPERYHDRRARL